MSDPRFARLRVDPRFRRVGKRKSKVVVDERFKSVLEDEGKHGKKSRGRVDKYGRKVSSTQQRDNLRRFYRQEEEELVDDEGMAKAPDLARGEVLLESSDEEEEDSAESDDGVVVLGRQVRRPMAPKRDESPEIDLNEDGPSMHLAVPEQKIAEPQGDMERTTRIAIVNLDWDHVRATHLYKIVSSLVSPTAPPKSLTSESETKVRKGLRASSSKTSVVRGRVLNVRVYPSDFGRERMRKEEIEGPPKELFKNSRRHGSDLDSEDITEETLLEQEDSEDENEALRNYQLERLRYYYAIVTCDTVEAASHIYDELDGTELERSGNMFDLSFVPVDMNFEQEFRDEASPETETAGVQLTSLNFSTAALRHSKVKLTWDDEDPERNKVTRRVLSRKEMEEGDFRALIASSSGSEQSDDDNDGTVPPKSKSKSDQSARERSRALLLGGGDADPFQRGSGDMGAFDLGEKVEGDLEITFTRGLSEGNKAGSDEETTLDKYKQKRREKRLQREKEKKERNQVRVEAPDGRKKKLINDDFFDDDTDEEEVQEKSQAKNKKRSKERTVTFALPESADEDESQPLALDILEDGAERRHFAMPAILKAEKTKAKKKRKVKSIETDNENADLLQEEFRIDVKDERFEALHKDHTFALDPTNPHFKGTSSMSALFDEQAKRRKYPNGHEGETRPASNAGGDRALQNLVQRVKRQSGGQDRQSGGKRRKT